MSLASHRRPASGTASSIRVRDHPQLSAFQPASQASSDARHHQKPPRPDPVLVCTLVPYLPYQSGPVPYPALVLVPGLAFWDGDVSWTHWPPPRHDRIHDVTTSSAASPIFKRLARASFGLKVSPCSLFLLSCSCGTLCLVIFRRLLYYASIFPSSRTRHPFSS